VSNLSRLASRTDRHALPQEFARSGIEVLVEVVSELKKRNMWPVPNFEIMIDGGVRRASDVLKAVALGATAVGIGRWV
jgi:L-lactate dehydrogenase (cytochrome)